MAATLTVRRRTVTGAMEDGAAAIAGASSSGDSREQVQRIVLTTVQLGRHDALQRGEGDEGTVGR